jgi:hypothetical protein
MVEKSPEVETSRLLISGDLPDFKSPIDGTTVHGRRGMREQFARHGVTHSSDFRAQWKKQAEQREHVRLGGSFDKAARREALREAYNKLRG